MDVKVSRRPRRSRPRVRGSGCGLKMTCPALEVRHRPGAGDCQGDVQRRALGHVDQCEQWKIYIKRKPACRVPAAAATNAASVSRSLSRALHFFKLFRPHLDPGCSGLTLRTALMRVGAGRRSHASASAPRQVTRHLFALSGRSPQADAARRRVDHAQDAVRVETPPRARRGTPPKARARGP